MRSFVTFISLFLFFASLVLAQSTEDVRKQIWIDFNPDYYLSPQSKIYGDIGVRREFENNGWWRLVMRPSYRTWLGGRFYFSTGLGNFFTFNEIINNRWEIRPFQGLQFNWPQWKTPLNHYIRLEERFDFNLDSWNSRNSIRIRYKLGISYRWAAYQQGRFWQATASAEAFYTFAGEQGQFQEQARATLGLDRSFERDLHLRIEITWQQERLFFDRKQRVSDIYFRLRFTQSWGNL
jgi:hypothetical protein